MSDLGLSNSFISSGTWSPAGLSTFPDPFMDMASLAMPETIQYALRWCVPGDTLVDVEGFDLRPISTLTPGTRVLTHGGTYERVETVSSRHTSDALVELDIYGLGHRALRITPEHKVWCFRTGGRHISQCDLDLSRLESVPAGEITTDDFLVAPAYSISRRETPRFSGWLLGMYVAEGCVIRNGDRRMGVRFTLGADDERRGILSTLLEEIRAGTGLDTWSYTPPSRHDLRLVSSHDYELTDWCPEHCGQLAASKSLSERVLGYGEEFALGLLAGWLDGDGCVVANCGRVRSFIGCTASLKLVRQMQRIANVVGMYPGVHQLANNCGFTAHSPRVHTAYQLSFNPTDCRVLVPYSIKLQKVLEQGNALVASDIRKGRIRCGNRLLLRVRAAQTAPYSGLVYDIAVENDHSFVAGGVDVSNCEFLVLSQGVYMRALDRVASYMLTDVEIGGLEDDAEKEKITDYLHEVTDVVDEVHTASLNYMVYGNDFSSIIAPFRRYLRCPKCSLILPLKTVASTSDFKFQWSDFDFHAHCPRCSYSGVWPHDDKRTGEEDKIKIKHWSPHEIDILWDPFTDDTHYIWKIPEDYRRAIKDGRLFHLERADWDVVQAVKANGHFRFAPDVIYHAKENTLAGIRNRGWGISRVLSNFRQAWYVQVLHRYNEAIALDYVIPFRLVTPTPGPGSGDQARDALLNLHLGNYMGQIQRMLRMRRKDPAAWFTLPFAVQYQALGGDARQLAPRDLLDQGLEIFLNNVGVPVELYKGSLQIQSAPAALRLFESSWSHLTHVVNGFLGFLMRRLGELLNWDHATARMKRVTHADDIQRSLSKLQLMMGGQLSKQTGMEAVGTNYFDEVRRQSEEQKFEAKEREKLTEDLQQGAMMSQMAQPQPPGMPPGAPPGGAMPGAPAPGGAAGQAVASTLAQQPTLMQQPTTPQEMMAKAQQLAQEIMSMPESQKDSELIRLKKTDPMMHAVVSAQIKDMRRQAQVAGGAMLMQQQFGKAGAAELGERAANTKRKRRTVL